MQKIKDFLVKFKKIIVVSVLVLILIIICIFLYKNNYLNKIYKTDQETSKNGNTDIVNSLDYSTFEKDNFSFLYKKDFNVKEFSKNQFSINTKDGKNLSNLYILPVSRYGNQENYINNILITGSSDKSITDIKFEGESESSYKKIINTVRGTEYYITTSKDNNLAIIENENINNKDIASSSAEVSLDIVKSLEFK